MERWRCCVFIVFALSLSFCPHHTTPAAPQDTSLDLPRSSSPGPPLKENTTGYNSNSTSYSSSSNSTGYASNSTRYGNNSTGYNNNNNNSNTEYNNSSGYAPDSETPANISALEGSPDDLGNATDIGITSHPLNVTNAETQEDAASPYDGTSQRASSQDAQDTVPLPVSTNKTMSTAITASGSSISNSSSSLSPAGALASPTPTPVSLSTSPSFITTSSPSSSPETTPLSATHLPNTSLRNAPLSDKESRTQMASSGASWKTRKTSSGSPPTTNKTPRIAQPNVSRMASQEVILTHTVEASKQSTTLSTLSAAPRSVATTAGSTASSWQRRHNSSGVFSSQSIKRAGDESTLAVGPSQKPVTSPAESAVLSAGPVKRHTNHIPKMLLPSNKDNAQLTTLYLGGLFELSGTSTAGRSELAAAQLAIEHVNKQAFIPGYRLHLVYNDTKCDPGIGSDAFYDLVYRKPTMIMLLTSSCSEVAKTLGEIVPHWHLLLISFAATTPALSKREKYPTFFRLAAADSSHNQARKTFIQHFGWDTVATFTQDLEAFSLAINEMATDFEKVNISLRATKSFRPTDDDLKTKMEALKETDARIIVGSFKEDVARQVFCEAYHQKMYGPRYVWMLTGGYSHRWWTKPVNGNCTRQQLAAAIDGYFSVESLNKIIGSRTSISGLTTSGFLEAYDKIGVKDARSAYAQVTYDTVWSVALTLKKTMQYWKQKNETNLSLSNFTYSDGQGMMDTFFNTMGSLEFMGVSGPVSFEGPDRRCITAFKQFQDGREGMVAIFFPENNTLDFKCHGCKPVIWKGGKLPADKYTILIRQELIHREAFFIVCAVSIFGIILALFFLGFNLYHRKLKYIKLSSPRLNNVAVVGCLFIYIAVVLLGLDDGTLPESYFPVVCTARAFLLAAGFSLAFGAMFTKTYRVHQIISRANTGLVKSKMLKDTHLLLIVGILLLLDIFLMTLWIAIDPMQRILLNLTTIPSKEDMDVLYIPQLSTCHSDHLDKWMGALYAYKGLLLLFGMYMAWETRNVKIPALNDSQYIGMNIYNVVLMSITVVVLSSLLSNEPSLSYAVVSALIILSTTGMLLLLFLPKIYAIIMHNGNPVITSSGLTVEANTRRFATDDRKELLYRAEVQNRVYLRELAQLDRDMVRLERYLEFSTDSDECLDDVFMCLISDSKVSDSPLLHRRRRQGDFIRCDVTTSPESITDADDVCMELPDISPSSILEMKQKLEKKDSGFHTMSFKNTNYVSAEEEQASRVKRFSSQNEEEFELPSTCHATRRQSQMDGSLFERQSLLTDSQHQRRSSLPVINAPCRTDRQRQDFELEDLIGSSSCHQGATSSGTCHANTWTGGAPVAKFEKIKRINILKTELSRIQTELQSLGELECEVSFV